MTIWGKGAQKLQPMCSMNGGKSMSFQDMKNLIAKKFKVDGTNLGDLFLKVKGNTDLEFDEELFNKMRVDERDVIQFWKKNKKTLQFDIVLEENVVEVFVKITRGLRIKNSPSRETRVLIPCK